MKVRGVTTVRAPRQSNQRLSHSRLKRVGLRGPAGLDSAFLVEPALFAQEEILRRTSELLDRETSEADRQTGSAKADRILSRTNFLGCRFTPLKLVTI